MSRAPVAIYRLTHHPGCPRYFNVQSLYAGVLVALESPLHVPSIRILLLGSPQGNHAFDKLLSELKSSDLFRVSGFK